MEVALVSNRDQGRPHGRVTPEWSRGSDTGGYLGKCILAGSVRADSHQIITQMPTGCQDLTMVPF